MRRLAVRKYNLAWMEQAEQNEKPGRGGGLRAKLAHAFAIESYDEESLEPEERAALERLAHGIHSRGLTAAAILWIDSQRGLNFIGSSALVFAQPFFELGKPYLNFLLRLFGFGKKDENPLQVTPAEYEQLYTAMEKRYSIEYLVSRLEQLQAEIPAPRGSAHAEAATKPQDSIAQDL
jgi:hypothetical protein